MKALKAIKGVCDKICAVIGTGCLGIMCVLVIWQVFARYILKNAGSVTSALSQYLFVWLIMFGSAYVYGSKEHLTIDILKDRFGPRMTMIVDIITNVVLFAFVLIICVIGGYNYTVKGLASVDASLQIPMAIIYVSLPVSGVITLVYAVYNCVMAVVDYKAGKIQKSDPLSGTA